MENSKELIINAIMKSMESHDIKIEDLPKVASIKEYGENQHKAVLDFIEVGRAFYTKLCDEIGEERAYNWTVENFDSATRTDLEIFHPRRYKVVTVTITTKVAVPQCFENSYIQEVVDNMDLSRNGDYDFDVEYDDVPADEIERLEYFNDAFDFADADFNE